MPKHHGGPWQPPPRPSPSHRVAPSVSKLDRDPGPKRSAVSLPPDLVASTVWLALSPASAHRYQSILAQFFDYNSAHGLAQWLPRDPESHSNLVLAWMDALWHGYGGSRCRSRTLRSRLSALSWCHRAFRGFAVTLSPQANLHLKALEATESKPRLAKHAATPALLWAARSLLNLDNASDRVLLGAAVLAYFFLLRKSEYAGSSGKGQDHRVRVKHISFLDKWQRQTCAYDEIESVQLRVPSSKTDKRGEGVNLCLKRSGTKFLCPVDAAFILKSNASSLDLKPEDPLCMTLKNGRKTPVRATQVARIVKQAAAVLGLDPRNFGSHSLRSGGATAMFRGNVSKTAIKLFGRWSSDAFERYIQIADCEVEDMSRRMVGISVPDQGLVGNHQPNPVALL
jgi:hypothetical protein